MSGARTLVPATIRVALPKDVMKKLAHVGVELGIGTAEAAEHLIALALKDYEAPHYQAETLAEETP